MHGPLYRCRAQRDAPTPTASHALPMVHREKEADRHLSPGLSAWASVDCLLHSRPLGSRLIRSFSLPRPSPTHQK